jgi:hypothetical protein
MESIVMARPSMPLTAACASSALLPAGAASVARVAVEQPILALAVRPVAVMAAERAPVSRVHQDQIQAELAQALTLDATTGTTSTTGFKGINVSVKRYADGGSGVPPRGRPV